MCTIDSHTLQAYHTHQIHTLAMHTHVLSYIPHMRLTYAHIAMCIVGWLRLVGSLKSHVSFAGYSLFYRALLQKRPIILIYVPIGMRSSLHLHSGMRTGWRRLIGSPKLQIIFLKRATKYRALLLKMTYKDKGSYGSSPPCISLHLHIRYAHTCVVVCVCV